MRILGCSHGYPPTISGVSLVVQKTARAMVRKGHQVTIVTASENRKPYRDEDRGVRLIRLRSIYNPFWKEGPIPILSKRQLRDIIDQTRPDVLHVQDTAMLAVQFASISRELGLPLVASCFYVPGFVSSYLKPNLFERIAWKYTNWLWNQFEHVIYSTATHRDFFRQRGVCVPATIISNGLDVTRYRPANGRVDYVVNRYDLPEGPRILFVGRLALDKKIDILIRAMPVVHDQQGAHLLIVGRGDDRERLTSLVEELGLKHCVHFLGFVPEADLPAVYRACNLFAIAATTEVQSIPTLQAAATGLPIVAVNAMALPELVHDGWNGYLVRPDDPAGLTRGISAILSDSQLARQMQLNSLSIAASHAEKHTFSQYEAVYEQLSDESWPRSAPKTALVADNQ